MSFKNIPALETILPDGVSPGICHQVAREEFIEIGDFIQATDSHTCMGGASNALTYGVGATEYASPLTQVYFCQASLNQLDLI